VVKRIEGSVSGGRGEHSDLPGPQLPGGGGSQRLPQLVIHGQQAALGHPRVGMVSPQTGLGDP